MHVHNSVSSRDHGWNVFDRVQGAYIEGLLYIVRMEHSTEPSVGLEETVIV